MNKQADRSNQLRTKAETQLARATPETNGTPRPAEEVLHELQVHQIELEMQNEEYGRRRLSWKNPVTAMWIFMISFQSVISPLITMS